MPQPVLVVAAAIVRDDPPRQVLAGQRARPPALAGYWELPGGKVDRGETDRQALVRECREELGVEVIPIERLAPDLRVGNELLLRVYVARLAGSGEPVAHEHTALRWVDADEAPRLRWLPGDLPLVPALRELLSRVDG
jgi:8-oxo-dGTP diphosphatase